MPRVHSIFLNSTLASAAVTVFLAGCAPKPTTPTAHGMCYVHLQHLKRSAAKDPAASQALFDYYGGPGHSPAKQQAILAKARTAGHPWAVTPPTTLKKSRTANSAHRTSKTEN